MIKQRLILKPDWLEISARRGHSTPSRTKLLNKIQNNLYHFTETSEGYYVFQKDNYKEYCEDGNWLNGRGSDTGGIHKDCIERVVTIHIDTERTTNTQQEYKW